MSHIQITGTNRAQSLGRYRHFDRGSQACRVLSHVAVPVLHRAETVLAPAKTGVVRNHSVCRNLCRDVALVLGEGEEIRRVENDGLSKLPGIAWKSLPGAKRGLFTGGG